MKSGERARGAPRARVPWLDINQERHHAYAGYDGMVELVRQIDLAIHNPVWAQVRAPAPWDGEGQLIASSPPSACGETPPTQEAGEGGATRAIISLQPAPLPTEQSADGEDVAGDPAFVARHRKKFAETRVDNTDPNFLAHHRKKFAGAAGDDMGEC